MNAIITITRLTFQEAWRRWMVLTAVGLGVAFVLLYGIGCWLIFRELRREGGPMLLTQNFLLLAGFYVVHFLTVMLSIVASVDTIAGEIASHTIQTLVTKPVRRWEVVLGKWLGYAAMIVVYLLLLGGGVLLVLYVLSGYVPPNILSFWPLLVLEALVLLSLSLLVGTRFSTLTNGVLLFMLYGLAFIGSWVEQIGGMFSSQAAVQVGVITSLVMPVEALWRRAAFLMQAPLARNIPSPFASTSVPSTAMVIYTIAYAAVLLLLAMRSFSRRDL